MASRSLLAINTLLVLWYMNGLVARFRLRDKLLAILLQNIATHHHHTLRAIIPGFSPNIEAVVMKALAKKAASRYNSISEFALAFKQAASQSNVAPNPGGMY